MRSSDPTYLTEVERYLEHLAPIVGPRQINHGGPIILMQVENEYGAYGNDRAYLTHLTNVYRNLGFVVPLTTVDQPMDDMLAHGTLPDLHTTGSFGSRIDERMATLREHQTTGPLMCSEFWIGWFDHWGAHHHTTDVADAANALDRLLGAGASVNCAPATRVRGLSQCDGPRGPHCAVGRQLEGRNRAYGTSPDHRAARPS